MLTTDLLKNLPPAPNEYGDAWSFGVDCALHGANTYNSHFSIFHNQASTDAWTAGKKAAEEYLAANPKTDE